MKINRIDIKGEVYDIEAYENPIPTGTVFPFAGIIAPEGFLLCNGQEVSRFTYAKLYEVIGDTYGTGDGSTTFNVPDYREVTLVGAGQNEKLNIVEHDIYNIGEFKDDQMQGHWHNIKDGAKAEGGGTNRNALGDPYGGSNDNIVKYPVSDGENGTPRIGSTTHGKQVGTNFIMKV